MLTTVFTVQQALGRTMSILQKRPPPQGEAYAQRGDGPHLQFYHWESLFVRPIAELVSRLLAMGSTSAVQPAMQLYTQAVLPSARECHTVAWRARHVA